MLIVASENSHEIKFFCKPSEILAIEKIKANNYPIVIGDDPFSSKMVTNVIINDG